MPPRWEAAVAPRCYQVGRRQLPVPRAACVTGVELHMTTTEWVFVVGSILLGLAIAAWVFLDLRHWVRLWRRKL